MIFILMIFCENYHKDINEGIHSFQIVLKKDGKLILKGDTLLENMIRFTHRHVVTNSHAYIAYSLNV